MLRRNSASYGYVSDLSRQAKMERSRNFVLAMENKRNKENVASSGCELSNDEIQKRVREIIGASEASTESRGLESVVREHCTCVCHVENFAGMQSIQSRDGGIRTSSARDSSHPATASYRSVRILESRPQSAPPALQKAYLRTLLMRQQLRAQVCATPEYMGRHSRCFGQEVIRERLLRVRRTDGCRDCSVNCDRYIGSRTLTPSSVVGETLSSNMYDESGSSQHPVFMVNMRTNFQALPKHNHVIRGNAPHFCNFVRNKKIHQRTPPVPPTGHEHIKRTSQDSGWNYQSQNQTNDGGSGREGRPSSPADENEGQSNKDEDSIQVPRIEIKEKAPKCAEQKPSPTKTAWAQNGISDGEDSHPVSDNSLSTTDVLTAPSSVELVTNTTNGTTGESSNQLPSPRRNSPVQIPDTSQSDQAPSLPASGRQRQKRERRPIRKKEKKVFIRDRRGEGDEDGTGQKQDTIPEAEEPEEAASSPVIEQAPPPLLPVPPPSVPPIKPRDKPTSAIQRKKSNKSLIVTDFSKFTVDVTPQSDNKLEQEFYEFSGTMSHGDHSSQKSLINTWSHGRLALSQQSSRFELPMDMKVLETMTPTEYLSRYCVVTSKRQWLYEKIYLKHKEPKLGGLSLKGLDKALKEALVDTVTTDDVNEIIELAGLTNSTKIDQKLFTGIAAMTERLLYPKFLTDDTQNIKDHKKEKIECADFCALDWKLHGVQVNPQMKKLLESL